MTKDPNQPFDIFRGLVTNDFVFRGVDTSDGAWLEHSCGQVVRFGPNASIAGIADEVRKHKCESYVENVEDVGRGDS